MTEAPMATVPRWRPWIAPILVAVMVAAVLWVQRVNGGGDFEPLRTADPCEARPVTSRGDRIEALAERLVLIALDEAACSLGGSREALLLELGTTRAARPEQVEALRAGLLAAVARLQADGELPPASALLDDALDSVDLNGLLEGLIRALPNGVVDAALKTDDILERTITDLSADELVANLDDEDALTRQLSGALTQAVKDSLIQRARDLLP